MLLFRSQLYNFLMYLSMAVIGTLGLPFLVTRRSTYWVLRFYCKTQFFLLRYICNIRVEWRGDIPQGEVIVASKHMSFLDILMVFYALPRPKFIMKSQLKWAPFIGFYAMRIGSAPVRRGQGQRAVKSLVTSYEREKTVDEAPAQTVIYPQGTRVLPGVRARYKTGAGVIYSRFGLKAVPVATNVGVLWARKSPYRYPGKAIVEFLPPVEAGLSPDKFTTTIAPIIEAHSDRLMRESGYSFPENYNPVYNQPNGR